MSFGPDRSPIPAQTKRLILAWQGARKLGINRPQLMKAIQQGTLDSYCVARSNLLYVDLHQIEAMGGRPLGVNLATDLDLEDTETDAPPAEGGGHEETALLREQLKERDLAERLEEAVKAKEVAQKLLREGEEELANLASRFEEEQARSSDTVVSLVGEKAALEKRLKVLEAVVENRDASAIVNSDAVRNELGAALREKENVESELLHLRLRVNQLDEIESGRVAAVGRLERKVRENAALEAEVSRLRARLDGLFDAEAERDRLKLELDDLQRERESMRIKLAELQVATERIKASEEERADLLASLDAALRARETLEGEMSPLRVELERMSQIENDRNRLAAQLETVQLERRVFDAEVHRVRAHTALLEEELKRFKSQEKRSARRRR